MSDNNTKKRRLGRGLEDLMHTIEYTESTAQSNKLKLSLIFPNPDQPRKEFDSEALNELAESIKEKGVIQPILVEKESDSRYLIIAGERRYRAAKMAGLTEIPVVFCTYNPREKLEIALIENIQRKDLNPIEEANAYNTLLNDEGITQDALAKIVGKNRATVANSLRLLKLSKTIQQALSSNKITSGHGRALLSVEKEDKREKLFNQILSESLSVRECEKLATLLNAEKSDTKNKEKPKKIQKIIDIEKQLKEKLKTKVSVNGALNKGKIEISYYSLEDLQRILNFLE